MSKGKWRPESCPDGHKEDAELAASMEDIAARLLSAARDLGIASQLVRQIETGKQKKVA